MDSSSYKGFWSWTCDSDSPLYKFDYGIETMTESLKELQKKLPDMFPLPPEHIECQPRRKNIKIVTSDNSLKVIQKSAKAIRSHVDFPFIIYYVKNYGSKKYKHKHVQYMHTPDDELYKRRNDKCAKCVWKLISKKKNNKKRTKQNIKDQSSVLCQLLPSQVTDRSHIHLPGKEEDFQKIKYEHGGKWMVFCSDLQELDNAWKNLIDLYNKGILVGIKSSTSLFSIADISKKYSSKAIMCYTADADCKSSVKRAAETISNSIEIDCVMYYKSNKASKFGQYHHEGFFGIPMYMFTITGKMYERDFLNRWKKVNFTEENAN